MAAPAVPNDKQQQMMIQDHPKVILICVILNDRHEASLACAAGLLRLQTALACSPERIEAHMHFVASLDAACNALRQHPTAVGAAVLTASMGFHPDFPLRALASGLPVVAACYPLPTMDWERVKSQPAGEDPRFWGNTYSIEPPAAAAGEEYVRVSEAGLGVAWIRKEVVTGILARRPELLSADGKTAALAVEGVFEGRRRAAHQRFLDLYGGDVYADLERPASSTGPLEFGGCVGMRNVLR